MYYIMRQGRFCETRKSSNSSLWSSQFLEDGEGADRARFCLSRAVGKCPSNLLWKVWLVGGRMELQFGRPGSAYKLFVQSYTDVPEKSLHFVFLELLRFEEYRGNFSVARSVLAKAREVCGNEWKVRSYGHATTTTQL